MNSDIQVSHISVPVSTLAESILYYVHLHALLSLALLYTHVVHILKDDY